MPFSFFANNPKLRRSVEFSIKLVILLLLFASLYWQVFNRENISEVFADILASLRNNGGLILLVSVLMLVNWSLEALKWWMLINRAEPLGYTKALLAVFSGTTLTLFTPNRIGEYGGRFLFLKNPLRMETLQATILGSIAQIWVTVLTGLLGMAWWLSHSQRFEPQAETALYAAVVTAVAVLAYLYFRLDVVVRWIGRLSFLRKYQARWHAVLHFSSGELLRVLLVALLRYAVYTLQFLLLLHALGVEITVGAGAALIATIFLLQSSVPTVAIIDLGIRGNLAVFVFTGFTPVLDGVVAAAFCLWFVNLVLPAIIGYGIILATKLFRE